MEKPRGFFLGRSAPDDGKIEEGGDMKLTPEQYQELFEPTSKGRSYADKNSIFNPWPNAVIPYQISYSFHEVEQTKILEAMREWETMTCIRFRKRERNDRNFITFFKGEGCFSELSMKKGGGQQLLSLGDGCFWRGTVEHELGHAIGLVHEHQRPMRDDYLGVNFHNLNPYYVSQLSKYKSDKVNKMGLQYDYLSVMHYGQHAFAVSPEYQTLFAVQNYQRNPEMTEKLGRVMGPSFLDAKLVNMMYNCNASCSSPPACRPGCFVDQSCQCFCEQDMPSVPCTDHLKNCAARAAKGDCKTKVRTMTDFCRKTCGVCAVGDTRLPPKKGKPLVHVVCKDTESSCAYWAGIGECRKNPDYMSGNCAKSCGICKGMDGKLTTTTTTTTTTQPLACEDASQSCENWARFGQCDINPEYMERHCRKSCGICGNSDIKPVSTCEDQNPNCKDWANADHCRINPGYMDEHCRKSCGLC
ncbi:hypothetical protein ACOMHN_031715 [Nucella lapillus]